MKRTFQNTIRAIQRSRPAKALAHGVYTLALRVYEGEHLPAASSLLSLGTRIGGPDSWALDFLGLIAQRRGDRAKAAHNYEAALQVDPRNTRALGRLAHSLLRLGERGRALAMAEQLRLLGDVQPGFALDFGRYLDEEGDHETALPWYKIAAESGHPTSRMCLAHCLVDLGRPEEALPLYERLVAEGESGGVHPSIALRSKLGIANVEFDLGNKEAALSTAQDALHEYENKCDEEDVQYAREVVEWLEDELLHPSGSGQ